MGKRGKASQDTQLGENQVRILLWLRDQLHKTALDPWWSRIAKHIEEQRKDDLAITPAELKPISTKGQRWNGKKILNEPTLTSSQEAALSKARSSLEARGLIACTKAGSRTTHAKLTRAGWKVADHWRWHGLSTRELQDAGHGSPEAVRYAELSEAISTRRSGLRYAQGIGDTDLEAKLVTELIALEAERDNLTAAVDRANAEALVQEHPNTPAAERAKQQLELPDFFEAVADLNRHLRKSKS